MHAGVRRLRMPRVPLRCGRYVAFPHAWLRVLTQLDCVWSRDLVDVIFRFGDGPPIASAPHIGLGRYFQARLLVADRPRHHVPALLEKIVNRLYAVHYHIAHRREFRSRLLRKGGQRSVKVLD
jgi:hypothetical protein